MDEPDLKIIDVFVCKLRKKLAEATGGDHYIETVWGRGYVLRDPEEIGAEPRSTRGLAAIEAIIDTEALQALVERSHPSADRDNTLAGELGVIVPEQCGAARVRRGRLYRA
jgi:DNA-binding winged helix-turn-helix (wHTH) protein